MSKIQIRLTLIIILLLVCNFLNAQIQVVSSVWDALTNEPLPYCNITIKDKNEGAITNADGKFILNIKSLSDSITLLTTLIIVPRIRFLIYTNPIFVCQTTV